MINCIAIPSWGISIVGWIVGIMGIYYCYYKGIKCDEPLAFMLGFFPAFFGIMVGIICMAPYIPCFVVVP